MEKWSKIIKTRFFLIWIWGACTYLSMHAYMKYVYVAFNTNSENYIFRDLIKQTYNMWDQTSVLESLKN